jgi:tetratricopeptide (TPR) repeat protein
MVKSPVARKNDLPPVWNLNRGRNPFFAGRERLLEELDGDGKRNRVRVLVGQAGTGKTSIASEYAYSRQEKYDIVWWVRGETQATIAADLAELAPRLANQPVPYTSPRQACAVALEELRRRERWLLIFDDVKRPQDIAPYLAAGLKGQILVTSTSLSWEAPAVCHLVEAWARAESVAYLEKRLRTTEGRHDAEQLASALGDLPLALEQAAACIEQSAISYYDYLSDFENLWAELIGTRRRVGPYPTHVTMAWELSFRRIEMLNHTAAQLLTICAFFASEKIPLQMILDSAHELPREMEAGIKNVASLHEAADILQKFALARFEQNTIWVHGVVSALIQDRLSNADRAAWATIAAYIAMAAFPFDSQNPQTWKACLDVLPHVLMATTNAQTAGAAPPVVIELLSRTGRFMLKQGQYADARDLLQVALSMVGNNKSLLASDIGNNLARALHRLGDLSAASNLYEHALQIDRAIYGPGDVRFAAVANNSAMTLVEMGMLAEARERFGWALAVYQKAYPDDHPKIASVMNNLGFVLLQQREYSGARLCLERAMGITEKALGGSHPQLACIAVNLGGAMRGEKSFAAARKLYERAIAIDEATYGPNHVSVARDLLSLGQLMSDQGDYEGAVKQLERALEINEAAYGPDHRETALCLDELGRALKAGGNVERAVDCMLRAAKAVRHRNVQPHQTIVDDGSMIG